MNLADLTERDAVLQAIAEFDNLGRDAFLAKYGFGPAKRYFLLLKGARYDSKAIVGAAYGYQYPEHGPLRPRDFSGGEDMVAKRLRALGFEVSTQGFAPRETRTWAFCANPKRYAIADAVKHIEIDRWTVGRSDIRAGDKVMVWQTRDKLGRRGIVAFGTVLEDPRVQTDMDNPYWVDPRDGAGPEARTSVRYLTAPNLPLWVDDSPAGEFLATLNVARAQGGTVFVVTQAQWDKIRELAGGLAEPSAVEVEAAELLRYRSRHKGGQGFGLSASDRVLVEQRAMALAEQYLRGQWDEVRDVSATASYDFLCRRGAEDLRVEVKGTTTAGEAVILTKNEVMQAAEPGYALFVVSAIELIKGQEATGGICTFYWPWNQSQHRLEPLPYTCHLDSAAGHNVRIE